jgi:hypothetical protein
LADFAFFYAKTTAYNAYLFNKYALVMNNWKNKAKNHRWPRNPIQLQKTSIILIALAKIIWPDLRPITLSPHFGAKNAPNTGKPASGQALRDAR